MFIGYTKPKDKAFMIVLIFCEQLDFYHFVCNLNTISQSQTIKQRLSSNQFPKQLFWGVPELSCECNSQTHTGRLKRRQKEKSRGVGWAGRRNSFKSNRNKLQDCFFFSVKNWISSNNVKIFVVSVETPDLRSFYNH